MKPSKRPRGRPSIPENQRVKFATISVRLEVGIKEAFEAWCVANNTNPNTELAKFIKKTLAE